jgi:hypothetical protein
MSLLFGHLKGERERMKEVGRREECEGARVVRGTSAFQYPLKCQTAHDLMSSHYALLLQGSIIS